MTHIFFAVRGVKHQQELFEKFAQTRMWPYKVKVPMKDKDGNEKLVEQDLVAQGAYREIKLVEYIVPDPVVPRVLNSLGLHRGYTGYWGKGWAKYALPFLRKLLGAKPMPYVEPSPVQIHEFFARDGVGIECIGIKPDNTSEIKWETQDEKQKVEQKLLPSGTLKEDL